MFSTLKYSTTHQCVVVVVVFNPTSHDFREEPQTDPKSMLIICPSVYPAKESPW